VERACESDKVLRSISKADVVRQKDFGGGKRVRGLNTIRVHFLGGGRFRQEMKGNTRG